VLKFHGLVLLFVVVSDCWYCNVLSNESCLWRLCIGVAPPSFVAIQAGTTLQQLTSSGDALSWQSVCMLAVLAVIALLPVAFRAKLKQKFDWCRPFTVTYDALQPVCWCDTYVDFVLGNNPLLFGFISVVLRSLYTNSKCKLFYEL